MYGLSTDPREWPGSDRRQPSGASERHLFERSHAARGPVARLERARAGRLSAAIWPRRCKSGKTLNKSAHGHRRGHVRSVGRATSTRNPGVASALSERDRGTSVEVSGAQCAYNCACGGFLWQPSRRSSSASNRRRHRVRWPWHAELPTSETIALRATPTCHCGGSWRGIGERWLRRPDAMDGGSCARKSVVHRTGSCAYSHGRAAPGVLCSWAGLRSPIANRGLAG